MLSNKFFFAGSKHSYVEENNERLNTEHSLGKRGKELKVARNFEDKLQHLSCARENEEQPLLVPIVLL